MAKIVKLINTTASMITLLGNVIDTGTAIIISRIEADLLADDKKTFAEVASGAIIVNDGTVDLSPMEGYQYLSGSNLNVSVTQTSEVGNKKLWVHQSAKPEIEGKQFYAVWTGAGDDVVNRKIGEGTPTQIEIKATDVDVSVDINFCFEFGGIYIHEAYAMWDNAGWGDSFSAYVVAKETILQTAVDLNYEMDGVRVKPAVGGPGTGTHGFTGNPTLVPSPNNTGYWNYDSVSGLTPSVTATGQYDIYTVEIVLNRFINKIPVLGINHKHLRIESADTFEVPYNYFVRLTAHNNSGTAWKIAMFMTLFRETTI